jgi:hypothetical protein
VSTRRSFLAAAGVVGASIPLAASVAHAASPSPSPAAPGGATVPETLARRTFPGGAAVRTAETSFPVSHLAISWTGAGSPGVRTRQAAGWGQWRDLHVCGGAPDGRGSARRSALVVTPETLGYEVSGRGVDDLAVTELNTVSGPARAVAAPARSELRVGRRSAPVLYLNRAGWGADESYRFLPDGSESWPPEYFPVQTLTVHHTAGINDDPDPAATVRAIYFDQAVLQDFGDIGYHALIDERGTVYEGRWSGADPVPVLGTEPGPDGRLPMVNAGHVLGFNAGNVGIALLGNFTDQLPTRAARRSLTVLLALLATVERLDPQGTTNYVNPISGATATVATIPGHRDWAATQCPGNTFYPQLPSLRRDVDRLVP